MERERERVSGEIGGVSGERGLVERERVGGEREKEREREG